LTFLSAVVTEKEMRPSTIAITLITLSLLIGWALWNYYPPLPATQHLTITFSEIRPGSSEPLIVTGRVEEGDFLYVKYLDSANVAFGYDKWGSGGPVSAPVGVIPSVSYAFDIQLPSLQKVRGSVPQPSETLRLSLNGVRLIDSTVDAYVRAPQRLYFAQNPLGGSACGARFGGKLQDNTGKVLVGGIRDISTPLERLGGWFRYARWQVIASILATMFVGYAWARLVRLGLSRCLLGVRSTIATHAAFFVSASICSVAFAWMVSYGSFAFRYPDSFGDFYDYQALSLLEGRLDVPGVAISGEAMVVHGKTYGYFGLTPALLRAPFVVAKVAFGSLTRLSMLAAYVGALLAAYLVLLEATQLAASRRPTGWMTVIFTLSVGMGSTLFFLAGRAFVYHEAIIWGLTFATWSGWYTLRYLAEPSRKWWVGAIICGILAVQARPPSGLFALTFLVAAASALVWRGWRTGGAWRHAYFGALGIAGVLSFNAVSYLKFGTAEGMPLRYNVQYNEKRMKDIGGREFHWANIPFGFSVYVTDIHLAVKSHFPWIYMTGYPGKPQARFPAAKIDMVDPTLSLPVAMPALFLFATAGGLLSAVKLRASRTPLGLIWVSALPMSIAMFGVVVVIHRYTADFIPFLILAAAFGIAAVDALPSWRWPVRSIAAGVTAWAICLTFALTLRYQGEQVWGVPDGVQQRYLELRNRVDGWILGQPKARN
jgi:hypothetical protein